jgi:hypothetical protein
MSCTLKRPSLSEKALLKPGNCLQMPFPGYVVN